MTPARQALQGRKQDFVRGEIWIAAVNLFSEKGYEATTVEDIADAAGVSRRTFFRYFASKDDLMVKAIDSYGDLLAAAIQSAPADAAPLELVRHAVTRVAPIVVAQPLVRETMAITLNSAAARRAQLSELEIVTGRIAGEYARVLGRRRKPYLAQLMASLTVAVLTQTFRTWYDEQPANIAGIVDEMLESLAELSAVRAPAGRLGRVARK